MDNGKLVNFMGGNLMFCYLINIIEILGLHILKKFYDDEKESQ